MKPYRVLSDEEWLAVAPLLPELQPRTETRGRPLTNTREVLNGVLWVMHSGASWSMLPRRFPSYQTCHRRFKAWERTGVLKLVLTRLFGEAGDEFLAAIVARMRNAQPDRAQARHDAAALTDATSAAAAMVSADKRWDTIPLQNAFAPALSRVGLMAREPAASLHERALTMTDALSQVPPACGSANVNLGANPGLNTMIECAKVLSSGLATSRSATGTRSLEADAHDRDSARETHAK